MLYNALDVAKYIITVCYSLHAPISNLKLQKMLYFVWIDFYKRTDRFLFSENFCAWQLGPVVPEVYYEFSSHAGRPIYRLYNSSLDSRDENVINEIIHKYVNKSPSTLVDMSHKPGSAWDVIFDNGNGNRKIIPFGLIIQKEAG